MIARPQDFDEEFEEFLDPEDEARLERMRLWNAERMKRFIALRRKLCEYCSESIAAEFRGDLNELRNFHDYLNADPLGSMSMHPFDDPTKLVVA